jgi:hypothetical protein
MANEDLVELFGFIGQVELTENLFDSTRSKGAGVAQFAQRGDSRRYAIMGHMGHWHMDYDIHGHGHNQVTYFTHIQWKVPHDCVHASASDRSE